MIRWIIDASLRHRFLVICGLLLTIAWGVKALRDTPVDAIPDLSENQVIVFAEWMGRSPQEVEDQVTYPLSVNLQGLAGVKTVRAISMFGFSLITVIFEDHIDNYFARARILERLNYLGTLMPSGVVPLLGPDATGLGWVYQYYLHVDPQRATDGGYDLGTLRAVQDWFVRYQLQSIPGVAEVASLGGFVKQYQVEVSSTRLRATGITLREVLEAVAASNLNVGGKVIEENGMEFVVRGVGLIRSIEDLESIVVRAQDGVPVYLRDVATIQLGGDFRRGALDVNGQEVVGGIVVMRTGENAMEVIRRVKERVAAITPSLPPGVELRSFYDRSDLITRTIDTLRHALLEEILLVTLAHVIFLFHFRSILIVTIPLPVSILISFILMQQFGISSHIMSLAGIAIAIGVLVDAGIVMTENVIRQCELAEDRRRTALQATGKPFTEAEVRLSPAETLEVVRQAAHLVGRPIFFAMAIVILAFIPVFVLGGQEGKLFHPLAYTKTFALVGATLLAVTAVPVLCSLLVRGPFRKEEDNRVMQVLLRLYNPILDWSLVHRRTVLTLAALLLASAALLAFGLPRPVLVQLARTLHPSSTPRPTDTGPNADASTSAPIQGASKATEDAHALAALQAGHPRLFRMLSGIGSEFMPTLEEGSLLYMPVLLPSTSLPEVHRIMAWQDRVMSQVPEVVSVAGKLGRAETATDPAPVEMIETTIMLKPREQWRPGLTKADLIAELTEKMTAVPGYVPGFLQPIENRILMISTGIRAQVGVKILGDDLDALQRKAFEVERVVRSVPGAIGVAPSRVQAKPYLEIVVDRPAMARYGLRAEDVLEVVEAGLGGRNVTTTIEGRERFPIQVRLDRSERDDIERLADVLIATPSGATIPLGQVATLHRVIGPSEISSENGRLRVFVQANVQDRDLAGFVEDIRARVAQDILLEPGMTIEYSGQYEDLLRARRTLQVIFPTVILVIFLLLHVVYGSAREAAHVLLAVPFALSGSVFLQYALGYPFSVAVWVGYITLFGIAIQTGIVMVVYLEEMVEKRRAELGAAFQRADLLSAIKDGARLRLRPKVMTVATTVASLLPIMWSDRTGAEVMKPLAAPVIGGAISSLLHILVVTPVIFAWLRERDLKKQPTTTL